MPIIKHCKNCQTKLSPDATVCPNCGKVQNVSTSVPSKSESPVSTRLINPDEPAQQTFVNEQQTLPPFSSPPVENTILLTPEPLKQEFVAPPLSDNSKKTTDQVFAAGISDSFLSSLNALATALVNGGSVEREVEIRKALNFVKEYPSPDDSAAVMSEMVRFYVKFRTVLKGSERWAILKYLSFAAMNLRQKFPQHENINMVTDSVLRLKNDILFTYFSFAGAAFIILALVIFNLVNFR
ncbi:MAG: hypothetical protein LC102_05315 [Ignavibacteriales bacterium]|nr:MAG: hypothetical protein F9K26_06790 [Ignavibacteriaceae bacterium]MBW7873185.1 hypothetical protein [Ignavibacteria bacterium]MCZ2142827.1 hypothetical protein [Ignavibacteriales bacterium]OQY75215.1 MAG: hypothetical protein B6D45_05915 [Ignavibacteriales bacterium UTCHB3]MBV6443921.1 hypothetical protein [Ignavibacteriaceae bacterium]